MAGRVGAALGAAAVLSGNQVLAEGNLRCFHSDLMTLWYCLDPGKASVRFVAHQ